MMELAWPETPCSLLMDGEGGKRQRENESDRKTSVGKVDRDTRLRLKGVMQSCVLRATAEPLSGGD